LTEAEIRAHFPGTRALAYFNAAAASLLPVEAAAALAAAAQRQCEGGILSWGRDMRAVASAREAVARLLGAASDDVAFVANTSEGIAKVAGGLDWSDGDEIVLGDLEYPANVYPWACQRPRGARLRFVPSEDGCLPAERLIAALGARTRVLAVSMVQFTSGYRVDLAPLAEACRRRGILFVLDAIQGLGVFPVDVGALGVGALAADGRKWLMGPPGSAFLYVAPEWRERIRPRAAGVESVRDAGDMLQHLRLLDADGQLDLAPLLREGAGRYEAGYPNVPSIAGLGASLALAEAIGRDVIRARVVALVERLRSGLERQGRSIHGPRAAPERSGIVAFDVPGDPDAWFRALGARKISLGVRGGRLRAAPHVYNDDADVDRLLEALGEIGAEIGRG
jgi:selenocysteine lyase/cysteine desulfurase